MCLKKYMRHFVVFISSSRYMLSSFIQSVWAMLTGSVLLQTSLMLITSNVFMTYAWYGHLKTLADKPLYIAILVSWGIAFFEYVIMVPANRHGFTQLSLPQLKILQEVITLLVFIPFSLYVMKQPLKLDFLWAALCMIAAVYFVFRSA
jgi:uncharacterized protein